jgi:hypothetical protein
MTPADEARFIELWTPGLSTAATADRPPSREDWKSYGVPIIAVQ